MTVGELARLFAVREGAGPVRVVPVANLRRATRWEETGLGWRPPSPNIPTLHTARVYPGFGLFEGGGALGGARHRTAVRAGRRPLGGAGALDHGSRRPGGDSPAGTLPGPVRSPGDSPAAPRPRFRDREVSGLAIRLAGPEGFLPVRAGLRAIEAVRAAHPEEFAWRPGGDGFLARPPPRYRPESATGSRQGCPSQRSWRRSERRWRRSWRSGARTSSIPSDERIGEGRRGRSDTRTRADDRGGTASLRGRPGRSGTAAPRDSPRPGGRAPGAPAGARPPPPPRGALRRHPGHHALGRRRPRHRGRCPPHPGGREAGRVPRSNGSSCGSATGAPTRFRCWPSCSATRWATG